MELWMVTWENHVTKFSLGDFRWSTGRSGSFSWEDHLRLTFFRGETASNLLVLAIFFFATEKLWNIGVWPWPRKNKNKINGSYCWHSGVTLYQRKWEVNADKVVCLSRFYMVLRMFYDIKWNSNFNIEFHSFGFVASCEDWNQAITHLRFKDKDPWKKLLDSIMFHHRTPHQQTRNKSTKHRITYVYKYVYIYTYIYIYIISIYIYIYWYIYTYWYNIYIYIYVSCNIRIVKHST